MCSLYRKKIKIRELKSKTYQFQKESIKNQEPKKVNFKQPYVAESYYNGNTLSQRQRKLFLEFGYFTF